jgi:N-sulfoglucosamine sulfohydrolase
VLQGKEQDDRDHVLTVFHQTSARRNYPMRCLQNHRFGYIRNAWSDGRTVFKNESQNGLSFRAMQRAAAADPAIAARVKLFQYRVAEELYDFAQDPDARRNLAHDPAHKDVVLKMRKQLQDILKQSGDPDRELFAD